MRLWSVTQWLIVINVAVFVIDLMTPQFIRLVPYGRAIYGVPTHLLEYWGQFTAVDAFYRLQLWRLITFQFLHASPMHLVFNMLALYFFGSMVENWLTAKKYLAFYLISGIGGVGGYMLLWRMNFLVESPYASLVGASAGIFGVLIAASQIAPNATVMLLFPPIPMRLRTMAWVFIGIAALTVLAKGNNAGGEAAHLGGAAVGYLLFRYPRVLDVFTRLAWPRRRRPRSFFRDDAWR